MEKRGGGGATVTDRKHELNFSSESFFQFWMWPLRYGV